jgi:Escherichia/Staphylococcus phage prohead protease
MEVRHVATETRTLDGVCIPYSETSYLTPNPRGERVLRGAFRKSAEQRAGRVFLYRDHDHTSPVGRALVFTDLDDGLHGSFHIRESVLGDQTLADVADGYLPALSVGFRSVQTRSGKDGATEVVEAALVEVSLVSLPAYEGAQVLALRTAFNRVLIPDTLEEPYPIVPAWSYPLT